MRRQESFFLANVKEENVSEERRETQSSRAAKRRR